MTEYTEAIRSTSLFEGIEESEIEALLNSAGSGIKKYGRDEYIRHAQDPADFIGIVLEGSIRIQQYDFYGNRNITSDFGRGSLFAEAFACSGAEKLPVDIVSCAPSVILFLDRSILSPCESCCSYHHRLIGNLLRIVAGKNMVLTQKLRYISHRTTGEKLMSFLDDQAKLHHSPEFDIPFDRQALADYLGVERSAMSAEISKLVKEGYIKTKRSHFILLKPMN